MIVGGARRQRDPAPAEIVRQEADPDRHPGRGVALPIAGPRPAQALGAPALLQGVDVVAAHHAHRIAAHDIGDNPNVGIGTGRRQPERVAAPRGAPGRLRRIQRLDVERDHAAGRGCLITAEKKSRRYWPPETSDAAIEMYRILSPTLW